MNDAKSTRPSGEHEPDDDVIPLLDPDRGNHPASKAPEPRELDRSEEFEVVGADAGASWPPRPSPVLPRAGARLDAKKVAPVEEPEPRVDQVWTRGAEWGQTLAMLGVVGLGLLLLIYLALAGDNFGLAFFLLVFGGAGWVVLSYPIVITLERPVRITPEQAVTDYFQALSHHLPHFRRMWLLLSTPARTSGCYGSFEGFRAYWKETIAALKGERAGLWTPLVFVVEDFQSAKSAGRRAIQARFTLKIFIRGRRADGPIATFPMRVWTVKGPDAMWYLDDGTLPEC